MPATEICYYFSLRFFIFFPLFHNRKVIFFIKMGCESVLLFTYPVKRATARKHDRKYSFIFPFQGVLIPTTEITKTRNIEYGINHGVI